MTPAEYLTESARTECDQDAAGTRMWKGSHPNSPVHLVRLNHAVIGMLNELGELSSLLQKAVYYGFPFTEDDLRSKLRDETGDLLWHYAQLLRAAGLTFEEVMEGNVAKLRSRYPDKFDLDRRISRDQDAEARAVEVGVCSFCKGDKSIVLGNAVYDCTECAGGDLTKKQIH